jgi:Zn-dependent protease with chaperone function
MKSFIVAFAFLSFMQQAMAQAGQQGPTGVTQDVLAGRISCNDPRILALPMIKPVAGVAQRDFNFINCVALRLIKANRIGLPAGFGKSWVFTSYHSDAINSLTAQLPNGQLVVLAFDSMARFLNYDPDEEAFIIAHEIGHVQDWTNCQAIKTQKVNQAPILKQLALARGQQACEENADDYGLQFMWGAGFNPFAAGGLFGRLEMYLPNDTRGAASILNNFVSTHPISSERVKKLRVVVSQLCSRQGTVCRP